MRTVKLYGELGKKFGEIHRFDINTGSEAIRALCANYPNFEKYLLDAKKNNIVFKVLNGESEVVNEEGLFEPIEQEIKIIPMVAGSGGVFNTILGTTLIIAGSYTGQVWLVQTGAALALNGVAQLLSPQPTMGSLQEKEANRPSYLFNGPVNTTQQGMPVPLCYGELIVGSAIISASISTEQVMAGYRYVQIPQTVDIISLHTEDNYSLTPPENFYRKELIESGIDGDGYNYWIFRFYYYVDELEAVPV